jgi:hypothetical protein
VVGGGRHLTLGEKLSPKLAGGTQPPVEQFQRDRSAETPVFGAVHDRSATSGDERADQITGHLRTVEAIRSGQAAHTGITAI